MNYTYTTRMDYFMLLFFSIGGGAIGYAMELEYTSVVGCAAVIPFLILLVSYAHSDIEIQLDGVQRHLVYTYSQWGKKTTQRYPLDELTYTYRSMFTQHGKFGKLKVKHGKIAVLKSRVSARSLDTTQQEHLADCLGKLGVEQR